MRDVQFVVEVRDCETGVRYALGVDPTLLGPDPRGIPSAIDTVVRWGIDIFGELLQRKTRDKGLMGGQGRMSPFEVPDYDTATESPWEVAERMWKAKNEAQHDHT